MTEPTSLEERLENKLEGTQSVFEQRALHILRASDLKHVYGDAAYVIAQKYRKPPRPFTNELPLNCECGSPYLKVGTHCSRCHSSFVETEAYELHLENDCDIPETSVRYVLTEWGGYRLKRCLPEGKAWMLGGRIVDVEDVPYVADYVEPIPVEVVKR